MRRVRPPDGWTAAPPTTGHQPMRRSRTQKSGTRTAHAFRRANLASEEWAPELAWRRYTLKYELRHVDYVEPRPLGFLAVNGDPDAVRTSGFERVTGSER